MADNGKRRLDCFAVTDGDKRDYWTRIGAAFENRDGSITCRLDALPVNGKVVIREVQPRDHGDAR